MQSEKDKWIEDVLGSADGIKRASSSELTKRVMTASARPAITQDKETWVNEVMDSTTGIQPATVSHKIDAWQERILNQKSFVLRPPESGSVIWRIAASVVLVLLLNAVSVYAYQTNMSQSQHEHELQSAASVFELGQSRGSDPGSAIFAN